MRCVNFLEESVFYGSKVPEDYTLVLINSISLIDYVFLLFPFEFWLNSSQCGVSVQGSGIVQYSLHI